MGTKLLRTPSARTFVHCKVLYDNTIYNRGSLRPLVTVYVLHTEAAEPVQLHKQSEHMR